MIYNSSVKLDTFYKYLINSKIKKYHRQFILYFFKKTQNNSKYDCFNIKHYFFVCFDIFVIFSK